MYLFLLTTTLILTFFCRLKTLIKSLGGPDSIPKKKTGSVEKVEKTAYVISLVDILRAQNDNDYSKVAKILQLEMSKGKGKKGFNTTSVLLWFIRNNNDNSCSNNSHKNNNDKK